MPCYHPMIRVENLQKWETAKDGHKFHPAKIVKPSKYLGTDWRLEDLQDLILRPYTQERLSIIGCGNCIGCRLETSRQWANRGFLECKNWKQSWFVTLTYDDIHLPIAEEITTKNGYTFTNDDEWEYGCLFPKDLQQFNKNLRQIMKREYNQDGIRFMAAGEYGSDKDGKTRRPHYHLIIFNLKLPQETFYSPVIHKDNMYWQNTIIERAWGKGIYNISEANWNDIAYTARYITKKINGPMSEEEYAEKGQIKEFFRASNRPGIGRAYFDQHWREIYKNDEIIIKNQKGIVSTRPPRYFDNLLKYMEPELYDEVSKNRKIRAKQMAKVKDQATSLDRLDQLEVEERSQTEKHLALVREFERGS